MAKKTLKKKVQAKSGASNITPVLDSARDIWLAGLGAFSVAQTESGKLIEQGTKLFDKLVSEGNKLEKQTRNVASDAVGGIRGGVESRVDSVKHQVDSVKKQAVDNWDKLETVFEDRVARVLGRLGVPTADDVNKLSARVQKLSQQVAKLDSKASEIKAATKKAAAKPAAKKAVAKKAVAKKAAAKAAAKPAKKADSKPAAKVAASKTESKTAVKA